VELLDDDMKMSKHIRSIDYIKRQAVKYTSVILILHMLVIIKIIELHVST